MSIPDSLSWPLVLQVALPEAGDPLIGTTPTLSPDLAPAAWALVSGSIGNAVSVGSWRDPYAPAFFSGGGSSVFSINMALPSNRGLAIYAGFGRYLPYLEATADVDPAYDTDPGMLIELLGAGAAVVASLKVVPGGGGASNRPVFDLQATAVGASPATVDGPSGAKAHWASPWHRTLALAVSPTGVVTAGFRHPGLIGGTYGALVGTSPLAAIESLRITTTPNFGLTFLDVHKQGMADAGPQGIWWRSRVNCIEQSEGGGVPEEDWGDLI